jgi:hypothetical protein
VSLAFAVLAPRLASAQAPLADEWIVNSNIIFFERPNSVACDALANCAISWQERYLNNDFEASILVKSFDPHGEVLAERVVRDHERSVSPFVTGLPHGFTVFWSKFTPFPDNPNDGITNLLIQPVVRRFSPAGEPLGPELRVNSYLPGIQTNPQTAAAPNGEFVIVWQSADQDGELEGTYAQRFSSAGLPVGPEFRVNDVTRSAQRFPRVAADPNGNFVVVWRSFIPGSLNDVVLDWDLKARLFRADGSPVTGEILVNQQRAFEQGLPLVAFAPNGTFIVTWDGQTLSTPDSEIDIHARRFAASPGEEPCAVAGAKVFCDTGRTGGLPEMSRTFGGRPGEVTLLADADGDKREDICAWYAGRFRCDLDHEGPPSEWTVLFGLTSDTPLFGDVDGDGRAEPCVRRKRRLLCDTAHDGGSAETWLDLELPAGARPVFGNVDGL